MKVRNRTVEDAAMGIRILFLFSLLSLCLFIVTGCSSNFGVIQSSGSGFLRKEFLEYKSVAVLPFGGDDSGEVLRAFTESFHEKFPQISIVDRKRVAEYLREQPLDLGQADDATRARVGKTLEAQALITGNVYYPTIGRWLFQVIILDTETGRVMGRSLAEIDLMGALRKAEGARIAVEKLTLS